MNWAAINFDWNQARALLATIEEGSLSGAARVLGLTQPTLGRQVAALEEGLGVVLFERSGRTLIPTPAAREIADHVRRMGDAATAISLAATGQSQSVEGLVRITATEMGAMFDLPPFVRALRQTHPGIEIEVIATNELSDLRQREADIAIRNSAPKDPDMIARRLSDDRGGIFGTEALVARLGIERLEDFRGAPFVGFSNSAEFLGHLQGRGLPISSANIVASSNTHVVHWQLAREGIGLGLNSCYAGSKTGGMVQVLPQVLDFEYPVWLVAPRELKTNARLRVVFDALAAHIGARQARAETGA